MVHDMLWTKKSLLYFAPKLVSAINQKVLMQNIRYIGGEINVSIKIIWFLTHDFHKWFSCDPR